MVVNFCFVTSVDKIILVQSLILNHGCFSLEKSEKSTCGYKLNKWLTCECGICNHSIVICPQIRESRQDYCKWKHNCAVFGFFSHKSSTFASNWFDSSSCYLSSIMWHAVFLTRIITYLLFLRTMSRAVLSWDGRGWGRVWWGCISRGGVEVQMLGAAICFLSIFFCFDVW